MDITANESGYFDFRTIVNGVDGAEADNSISVSFADQLFSQLAVFSNICFLKQSCFELDQLFGGSKQKNIFEKKGFMTSSDA